MALEPVGGGGGGGGAGSPTGYTPISSFKTFRVLADNTTEEIHSITAMSNTYGVTFTFFIKESTFETDGGGAFTSFMTGLVDDVCGLDHVVGFRTEQDLGPDQLLYNFAVITVGTDDGSLTTEARVRMDGLEQGLEVTAINKAWDQLSGLIAGGTPTTTTQGA